MERKTWKEFFRDYDARYLINNLQMFYIKHLTKYI